MHLRHRMKSTIYIVKHETVSLLKYIAKVLNESEMYVFSTKVCISLRRNEVNYDEKKNIRKLKFVRQLDLRCCSMNI